MGGQPESFELSVKAVQHAMPSILGDLNNHDKEKHSILLLPHIDAKTFEFFSEWALTKEIEVPPNDGGVNSSVFWSTLSKVYSLAEELKATALKRYIVDTIYASLRDDGYGPNASTIHFVYGHTSGDSGIRRIIVAFFVWQAAEAWWNVDKSIDDEDDWALEDMPAEFQKEVSIAALERIHLMDDGNPFNDFDEAEETGFGPDYFYDEDLAIAGPQKWLRNDRHGFRAEEEWDAARFEVDKEKADDGAMINDDDDAIAKEEQDAVSIAGTEDADDTSDYKSDTSQNRGTDYTFLTVDGSRPDLFL